MIKKDARKKLYHNRAEKLNRQKTAGNNLFSAKTSSAGDDASSTKSDTEADALLDDAVCIHVHLTRGEIREFGGWLVTQVWKVRSRQYQSRFLELAAHFAALFRDIQD